MEVNRTNFMANIPIMEPFLHKTRTNIYYLYLKTLLQESLLGYLPDQAARSNRLKKYTWCSE